MDAINGLVRCVHPGIDNHVSFGTVLSVNVDPMLMQTYMDVEDLEGRVLNAIKEYTCDLTTLGNYGNSAPSSEPVTSGHWDDVTYDSQTDTTTFTDFSATFPPHAVNWWLQPDAARSTYLEIVSLSASQLVVEGDATGLCHGLIPQPGPPPLPDLIGTFYTIVWPAGVDPATGTLAHNNPCKTTSRLLFAGYYYMPPVAGTLVPPPGGGTGVHGQQPVGNHHGDYYCWNRVYAQKTGRWTTTDPAMSPVWNLFDYSGGRPASSRDPSGMESLKSTLEEMESEFKSLDSKGVAKMSADEQIRHGQLFLDMPIVKNLANQEETLTSLFSKACKKNAYDKIISASDDAEGCIGALLSGYNCCDEVAAALAKHISDSMWARLIKSGQRAFGNEGNKKAFKIGEKGRDRNPLYPDWCDCGDWANLTMGAADLTTDKPDQLLVRCPDSKPETWAMFRLKEGHTHKNPMDTNVSIMVHNWTRFCWGKYCVDVDPWEKGYADGSVSGEAEGDARFHSAHRAGSTRRTTEWAERIK